MPSYGMRLISGYFRRRDITEPASGRVEACAIDPRSNCTWFSVDTGTGRAIAVNFQDARTNSALAVRELLEAGEAVLVVSDMGRRSLEDAHRDAIVSGHNDLDFHLPLADVVEVAHLLITAERVYVFDDGPPCDSHPLVTHLTRRDDFLALLA